MENLTVREKRQDALMTLRVRVGMNRFMEAGRGERGKQQEQKNQHHVHHALPCLKIECPLSLQSNCSKSSACVYRN